MGEQEKLEYAQMLETAKNLKTSANNMQDLFANIESLINTLNEVWQSDASTSCANQFNELKRKLPSFYNAVDTYAEFLNQTVEAYQKSDQELSNIASNNLMN